MGEIAVMPRGTQLLVTRQTTMAPCYYNSSVALTVVPLQVIAPQRTRAPSCSADCSRVDTSQAPNSVLVPVGPSVPLAKARLHVRQRALQRAQYLQPRRRAPLAGARVGAAHP